MFQIGIQNGVSTRKNRMSEESQSVLTKQEIKEAEAHAADPELISYMEPPALEFIMG